MSCAFASCHHQRTAQIIIATATRRIAKAAALVRSRLAGVSTSIPFIMDNLKKNLLYFPTRIFSVLTYHNFLSDVPPGLFQQPGFYCLFTGISTTSGYFIPGYTVAATDAMRRIAVQRGDISLIRFFYLQTLNIPVPEILHLSSKVSVARIISQTVHIPQNINLLDLTPVCR